MFEDCFAHLGKEAMYQSSGAAPFPIRVLIKQPDTAYEMGDGQVIGHMAIFQACRYLVINSGTSQSPEFTRQRDRYACGALAALRPFNFKSPTGLKINTTTMADAFSDALYFSYGKTSGLRLPGTTRLGVPPSLARSGSTLRLKSSKASSSLK